MILAMDDNRRSMLEKGACAVTENNAAILECYALVANQDFALH